MTDADLLTIRALADGALSAPTQADRERLVRELTDVALSRLHGAPWAAPDTLREIGRAAGC